MGANMHDLLKEIILDAQEQPLVCGVPRHLSYEIVPGKAFVAIGVRRCGKSTLLAQVMERLATGGVHRSNLLYVNFFDDRLDQVRRGNVADVPEAYYSLYPEKRRKETVYCFLDEIQMVDDWEPFVDRLLRTEHCHVFLTGSSSRMLSKEIATQMRGRSLTRELFPFSFGEFLDSRSVDYQRMSSRTRTAVRKGFDEFWERGGFPEVANASARVRVMTHQDYFRTIVHRDVVERNDAAHPQAVADLSLRLVNQVGAMYSVNALTGYLKSLGHRLSKSFVAECLEWLEDAYFLFSIRIFHPSLSIQNANTKKVYAVDHAMVRSVSNRMLVNSGYLLENLVFSRLRSLTPRIHYYRTGTGKEVDFIWQCDEGAWRLTQVCESLAAEKTRKREIGALLEAMAERGVARGTIVTRNETETVKTDVGVVEVLPAWRWLLL